MPKDYKTYPSQPDTWQNPNATKAAHQKCGAKNRKTGVRCYCKNAYQALREFLPSPDHWVAYGTWLLAGITLWAVWDAESALQTSQRAWLMPQAVQGVGPPTQSLIQLVIPVQNIGKTPAFGVHASYQLDWGVAPAQTASDDEWQNLAVWRQFQSLNRCRFANPLPGNSVSYPGDMGNFYLVETTDKSLIADAFSGKRFLVVLGCIGYKTFGQDRYSSFCYFLRSPDAAVPRWRTNACPVLNDAN